MALSVLGWLLLLTPLGGPLERFSFDLPFLFQPPRPQPDVAMVYIDEQTLQDVPGNPVGAFHRTNHARLLSALHSAHPRLVVYDFIFAQADTDPQADAALLQALRRASNVLLAAVSSGAASRHGGGQAVAAFPPTLPLPEFRDAALGWGTVNLGPLEADGVLRRLPGGEGKPPHLTWLAYQLTRTPTASLHETTNAAPRWLRVYGPPGSQPPIFEEYPVTELLAGNTNTLGLLRDRIVVVGARGLVGRGVAGGDLLGNPFRRFAFQDRSFPDTPGPEMLATAIQNLRRGEWLSRPRGWWELAWAPVWGCLAAWMLLQSRWRHGPWMLAVTSVLGILLAILIQLRGGLWFAWAIPFIAQSLGAWVLLVWSNPEPVGPPVAFLSYRRESGAEHARLVRAALRDRRMQVFLDVEDLGAGAFDAQLLNQIPHVRNFLLILAPGALDRCHEPADFLRLEIERALASGTRVIPIQLKDFHFPNHDQLPATLAALPKLQAIAYSHEDFDGFIVRLVDLMRGT